MGYPRRWSRSKIIGEIIAFYQLYHRFPNSGDNQALYQASRWHFKGFWEAVEKARKKLEGKEERSEIPCGEFPDGFMTRCFHANDCYLSGICPIAVPGTGSRQYCGAPIREMDIPLFPGNFRKGWRTT